MVLEGSRAQGMVDVAFGRAGKAVTISEDGQHATGGFCVTFDVEPGRRAFRATVLFGPKGYRDSQMIGAIPANSLAGACTVSSCKGWGIRNSGRILRAGVAERDPRVGDFRGKKVAIELNDGKMTLTQEGKSPIVIDVPLDAEPAVTCYHNEVTILESRVEYKFLKPMELRIRTLEAALEKERQEKEEMSCRLRKLEEALEEVQCSLREKR